LLRKQRKTLGGYFFAAPCIFAKTRLTQNRMRKVPKIKTAMLTCART